MLVLQTATQSAPEGKGVEGAEGKGEVTLSGSMTRQVSSAAVRHRCRVQGGYIGQWPDS